MKDVNAAILVVVFTVVPNYDLGSVGPTKSTTFFYSVVGKLHLFLPRNNANNFV